MKSDKSVLVGGVGGLSFPGKWQVLFFYVSKYSGLIYHPGQRNGKGKAPVYFAATR